MGASAASAAGSASEEVHRVYTSVSGRSWREEYWSGAYQVVTEQLHDEGGVLVALLAESVELCCDRQRLGV